MNKMLIILALLCNLHAFSQSIYYVSTSGNDANSGTSWSNAFRSIQKAITSISSGQIWVAKGTYYPNEGPDLPNPYNYYDFNTYHYIRMKENVAIYGGFEGTENAVNQRDWKTNITILSEPSQSDGSIRLSGSIIDNDYSDNTYGSGAGAVLDGFTITKGNANFGGGIHNEKFSPTIANCTFINNHADAGGGAIANFECAPTIINCQFLANSVRDFGGAICDYSSRPFIKGCNFSANTAGSGGAIFDFHAFHYIDNCNFSNNKANSDGGVISVSQDGSIAFTNCSFSKNSAPKGGAISYVGPFQTNIDLNNCIFKENNAIEGGAIYNSDGVITLFINNCTFLGNYATEGGAMANHAYYILPNVTNSILWGNSNQIYYNTDESKPIITYSIVQGGYEGAGNINDNPQFVDPTKGDLHLKSTSPAINTGSNAAVTTTSDLDNHPRIVGGIVDMGAYEYQGTPAPLTLHCPGDFTVNNDAGICGAVVNYTGEQAAFSTGGTGTAILNYSPALGTLLPVGENRVIVTATDLVGQTSCTFTVTVKDTEKPVINNLNTDLTSLWPANHKPQPITLNYTSSDNCGVVKSRIIITSNEPQNGLGDGDTDKDWEIIDDHHIWLRAERSGKGEGRTYTITLQVWDATGNTSNSSTIVTVPKNMAMTKNNKVRDDKKLEVQVLPNPATAYFTLVTSTNSNQPITIKVVDVTGKVMEVRQDVKGNGRIIVGQHLLPGMYYAEVMQGDKRIVVKLSKQSK